MKVREAPVELESSWVRGTFHGGPSEVVARTRVKCRSSHTSGFCTQGVAVGTVEEMENPNKEHALSS